MFCQNHPLHDVSTIDEAPSTYLHANLDVFAVFDHTQDSGNVSYGVRSKGKRYFIKTAGNMDILGGSGLSHSARVSLLRNAVCVSNSCNHPARPILHGVIESILGPMLVYDWVDGQLLYATAITRNDTSSAFHRFRLLPVIEILKCLDTIYELHNLLAQKGWVAIDFYDGCLIYDFKHQKLSVVDLDHYHQGPLINKMGRMFGSARFMAPEEFEQGAVVDGLTNVFTMGRTAAVLLFDNNLNRAPFRGADVLCEVILRACQQERDQRYQSVKSFHLAWREARGS
ncbi:serine/threonine protein kinase [Candidatus Poribacteria bacterium]|nr:serine/threonine protein kinase [Candidatus Poribacteria bacterium]MEE2910143.1 serine/threonine protein kinase [Candidatus Poribacteria bacterium]